MALERIRSHRSYVAQERLARGGARLLLVISLFGLAGSGCSLVAGTKPSTPEAAPTRLANPTPTLNPNASPTPVAVERIGGGTEGTSNPTPP